MNILKAAMTVSAMTLLSRITGLLRETLTARMLGAGAETDAFFVAFRIPNLLRRLFAEGAFSQAFVPILAQVHQQKGHEATADLLSKTATVLFWTLSLVTLGGMLGASGLVWAMASGLQEKPESYSLAVILTRWMFPYILLISLVSLSSGVLNTYKKFAVPAATPVLLNLSFIVAVGFVSPHLDQPVFALAGAVIVGGMAQLAVQLPALKQQGLSLNIGLRWSNVQAAWSDPLVRRILRQMLPASLAVSVAQVSLIINTQIASHLPSGSVSWVSYGDRLMEFPTAMLGVALGTVLLPSLARVNAAGDGDAYARLLDWGLRIALALALPAAVGLATFSEPLTAMLFHYGKFDALDVEMTRRTVLGYSVGLFGLIAVKVLAPGFYAKQDIRTPVKIGIMVVIATQLMNLIFVPMFGHAGLPLSVGLGASLNALVLWWGLKQRGTFVAQPGWLAFSLKIFVASAFMGLFLNVVVSGVAWLELAATPALRIAMVMAVVSVAAGLYFLVLFALRLSPRMLLRRPVA